MIKEEIIKKINGFTLNNLVSKKSYQWLKQEMTNADIAVVDCYIIAKALEEKMSNFAELKTPKNQEVYNTYLSIIAFFKLRYFMNLSNEEAGNFMNKEVVKANSMVVEGELFYDFIENLYTSLDPIFDWNGDKRLILLESLKSNEELLGKSKLKFAGEKAEVKPYLKNWLRDYEINFAAGKERSSLDRLNYLNNSELVKSLTESEKKVLMILLEIFDILKFFKFKPEPRKFLEFWEKEAAKLRSKSESTVGQEVLFNLYRQTKRALLDTDYKNTLANLSQDKVENLVSNLESFILENNLNGSLASLEVLGRKKNLNQALIASKKLIGEFKDFLETRYSHEAVKSITGEHFEGAILSLFLKFILVEKLKITPEQAAVFDLHLANQVPKEQENKYLSLVYGDVKTKMFKWREVVEENGQLKFQ